MTLLINNKKKEEIANIVMIAIILVLLSQILVCSAALFSPAKAVSFIETIKIQINPENEIAINNMTWNDFKLWTFENNTAVVYNDYSANYNCNNFSNDLRIDAEKEGVIIYRTVILLEKEEIGHSINYGCFIDSLTNEPTCALIEPQTGKVSFDIENYVLLYEKEVEGKITSIITKKGIYGENEKSIKRIY